MHNEVCIVLYSIFISDACDNKFVCEVESDPCRVHCIDKSKICDSVRDCVNGEDELNCPGKEYELLHLQSL